MLKALAIIALCVAALVATHHQLKHHHAPLAGPAVKVVVDGGHGSGVYVGNGLTLTAAHVVTDGATIYLLTDRGDAAAATVLWRSDDYDIALLRSDPLDASAAEINCTDPGVGSAIHLIGNPLNLDFVHVYGRVATPVEEHKPWKLAYLVDMTIANGMSGGPVLDSRNRLVGLLTGEAIHRFSMEAPFIVAIGYVVPASAVCTLLART